MTNMNQEEILTTLSLYFPGTFKEGASFLETEKGIQLVSRLANMPSSPLSLTHVNQLLHLNQEAGISDGFLKYYFLIEPLSHPYPVNKIHSETIQPHDTGIVSLKQLKWGIHRFFIDALLFYGDIRSAYRDLRGKSYEELKKHFSSKCMPTVEMRARGSVLPLQNINPDDRYLIAELACKAYSAPLGEESSLIESELKKVYKGRGGGRVKIKDLIKLAEDANKDDLQAQLSFSFASEEFIEAEVSSEQELVDKISSVAERFKKAHKKALSNTEHYLSIVNELDAYVATSMRNREDFREMYRNCQTIFNDERLLPYNLRYFDPTCSAAQGHEDKGLIECLMVKCSKMLIYFAGEKESFGKDLEAGMALSFGKPVIIYCQPTNEGEKRMKFFRDIHPLSRLIDVETGVAVGAMITNNIDTVVKLIDRIFSNQMEYDLLQKGDAYFRLREHLTGSIVRLQTNSAILRESFWNYYHKVP